MIRDENVASVRVYLLEPFHVYANAACGEQGPCPRSRHTNLHRAGLIEERNDEADAAEKDRGDNNSRTGEQNTADFSQSAIL